MKKKSFEKLSLKKEEIINLNDSQMNELEGGAASSNICWAVSSYFTGKIADEGFLLMKRNTIWIGCTTDPARSQMYGTPGCIAPYQDGGGEFSPAKPSYPVG
jgi:natural product precursor